jgi:hypothetical protein
MVGFKEWVDGWVRRRGGWFMKLMKLKKKGKFPMSCTSPDFFFVEILILLKFLSYEVFAKPKKYKLSGL